MLDSQPAGSNGLSASAGTTKSSCVRASALCSTNVWADAVRETPVRAQTASSVRIPPATMFAIIEDPIHSPLSTIDEF